MGSRVDARCWAPRPTSSSASGGPSPSTSPPRGPRCARTRCRSPRNSSPGASGRRPRRGSVTATLPCSVTRRCGPASQVGTPNRSVRSSTRTTPSPGRGSTCTGTRRSRASSSRSPARSSAAPRAWTTSTSSSRSSETTTGADRRWGGRTGQAQRPVTDQVTAADGDAQGGGRVSRHRDAHAGGALEAAPGPAGGLVVPRRRAGGQTCARRPGAVLLDEHLGVRSEVHVAHLDEQVDLAVTGGPPGPLRVGAHGRLGGGQDPRVGGLRTGRPVDEHALAVARRRQVVAEPRHLRGHGRDVRAAVLRGQPDQGPGRGAAAGGAAPSAGPARPRSPAAWPTARAWRARHRPGSAADSTAATWCSHAGASGEPARASATAVLRRRQAARPGNGLGVALYGRKPWSGA